jgi:PAS domain S-box-containing protein
MIKLANGTGSLREPDAALLRALLDSIPGRVSIIDTEDRYLYANKELLDFVGKPPSEVIGHKLVEIQGESALRVFAPLRDRVLTGVTTKFEGWITYFGDQRRYVKQVLTPYKSGDGKVEGFFFIGRDQTEIKEREIELAQQTEALRVSEATMAAVVLSALDGIIVIDEAARILEFNPAAEAMFGYSRSFAVGRLIADLIIPGDLRARHELGLKRYLKTGEASVLGQRIEVEAMRSDNSVFPVELSITEMRRASGRLFAAHIRDLTKAKAAQAEIEHQRERLHQAEKLAAMGSLLASVAHELNNPLAVLVAQSTLLEMKADDDRTRHRASRIHSAAERCGRIVKSFLAMARQKPPQRQAVDLNETVKTALEMSEYGRRSAGVELIVSLSEGRTIINADPDLLGQVVVNLLLNACHAVRDRRTPRRIWISTASDKATLSLSVADNGPGVAPEIRTRIFEPYFTTKPQGTGTGIGLAISRKIVEAHGGRIEVREREGGGAVFDVVFAIEDIAVTTPEFTPHADANRYEVLLVDDESDIAHSLAEILENLGHHPMIEDDPAQVLTRILTGRYDLVFADLHMPGLTALDLRQEISAHDRDLARRTIIVTGDTISGPHIIADRIGHADVIVLEKPFTQIDVENAIRRATGFARTD